jgi:hypothetical protein
MKYIKPTETFVSLWIQHLPIIPTGYEAVQAYSYTQQDIRLFNLPIYQTGLGYSTYPFIRPVQPTFVLKQEHTQMLQSVSYVQC